MTESRFYICKHCKNIVGLIHGNGEALFCCHDKMTHLEPRNEQEYEEKHGPVVTVDAHRVKVDVGHIPHPMTDEHRISWIYLQTDRGGHRKCLMDKNDPSEEFLLCDEKPVAAFAYCNMHGLWKTEIK